MTKLLYKKIQYFLVLLTFFMLLASLYFQYIKGLSPCPLCIMQRVCIFLLLGLMGLSLSTLKKAHRVSLLIITVACAGLYFSSRQLWLQSLPPESAPACMPGLNILINYFPWQTVVHALFWGSGDCAEVTWSFLGISMSGWGALYFGFMTIMGVLLFRHTRAVTDVL